MSIEKTRADIIKLEDNIVHIVLLLTPDGKDNDFVGKDDAEKAHIQFCIVLSQILDSALRKTRRS